MQDGFLNTLAGIVRVQKVSYHKFPCTTGAKFHGMYNSIIGSMNQVSYILYFPVTIGHETVMGKVMFFGTVRQESHQFDFEAEYAFLEELMDNKALVRIT